MDESQTADKVAIRNKLRANSFRLKDLLTKKPFVRSRDGSKDENGEENGEQNADNVSDESSRKVGSVTEASNKVSEAGTDRTRWRREGLSSLARSRSTASEKTATLISARYLRTRTRNSPQSSTGDKEAANGDNGKTAEKTINENANSKSENDTSTSVVKTDEIEIGSQSTNRVKPDDISENKHDTGVTGSAHRSRVTVGATLLRSPRTRSTSGTSNVPCSPVEKSGPQNGLEDTSSNNSNFQNEPDNISKIVNPASDSDADRKIKALSDLEKETDVNLVFDSENIGQTVPAAEDESGISEKNMEYRRSQSEFTGSQPNAEESHKLHRNYSEPTTSDKEQSSIRGSKSYDNTPDADFARSSPALKRSLAVTDLDKAMRDRDQQKLSSIFKDNSKDAGESGTKVPSSEDKTEVIQRNDSQLETDLDARLPAHRLATSSPRIRQRAEGPQSPPHSAPPVNPVAPMVYKPNVNLEDAVKWPIDLPGKLDFRKMEVFEGQMLLNWLSGSIDKSHYLRLVMTKHDINVIACQVCTCLVAAGVMKQLEGKDQEGIFKTDCMYYWTHTQQSSPNINQDVNKLQPMWPPTQEQTEDNRPGLKYTEADFETWIAYHQAAMVTLRHEYKEEVDTLQREHAGVLDKARQEYENRLQQAIERISLLQKEVEKYKCLAGIEKYSQNALSEADAAQIEAGLKPQGVNGFATPMTNTPSVSQYHTPAGTPDALNSNCPMNVVKSSNELFSELDGQVDGASCSSSDTTSLAGSVGEWSEGGTSLVPPPPAPPPPPGIPPPPAPPLPDTLMKKKALKPVVNPVSPMRPLFWNRIQVNDIKTPKHKEYYERKLVWEDLQEENVDISELDALFSKRQVEPSRRFSPNKPKNKAKQPAKVIQPKRSQVIGILLSSLRIEMSEIEHAILTFDTSQLPEEKLRQIYEIRGDNDELKKIKDHMKKHPDTPLDKPDQFLYDLSLIPDYAERIFCFIFREAFQESISVIETKMTNLRMTCQSLMSSIHVKRILGLVLALGNYMNGGSKSRGQADGFGIDILPKLKDVKSKDNSTSLLHYTVQQYIKKFERQDAGTDKVKFPLPDPSDLTQGCQVCFDELDKELRRIKKDFEAAEERAEKVIKSAREHVYLQPFKDIMTEFFEKGKHEFVEQEENLADGKRLFQETVIFFCVKPKSGDKEVTPEYFFSLWCTFCQDFKDNWKREEQKIIKQRIKENELRVKKMQQRLAKQPVRTRTRKAGGLKSASQS
ncbi:formin-like [Mercenaria mercenaria]|uniref:formin-like n=1 Tax=Mercenaria mercenaria TaxID=6596 RepID=UPI00234F72BC|nr:formin-like [Mercenaria mercenaria]